MQWREASQGVAVLTMLKRFLRWPYVLLFAALMLAILIPILRTEHHGIASAAGNGPQITEAGSVTKGQPFKLQVQGFRASEPVQLSWNGNGGQFLGILNTDATGAATNCASSANCIVSLPVPTGTYTLTAIGGISRLQASTSVSATISLVVTPQNVGPGSTIQVIGSGFLAGEALTTYFQAPANGTISTTADKTGSFMQALTLPKTYSPGTSYAVYVENAQSVVRAKASFSFETPSITSSITKVAHGTSITISGKGFLANESISLYWSYARFQQVHIGTANADASGNFTQTITLPSLSKSVSVTLEATGSSSKLQATTMIELKRSPALVSARGNSGNRSTAPDPKSERGDH
jgi:hypothetical protein